MFWLKTLFYDAKRYSDSPYPLAAAASGIREGTS
jgi:hypothetical protein